MTFSLDLPKADMQLGIPGFRYCDLRAPERLRDLFDAFRTFLKERAPKTAASYDHYRTCQGKGMTPEQVSALLLDVAPHVGAFVGRLFGVERELETLAGQIQDRSPLWRFKQDFAKKRVLKLDAGKSWKGTADEAAAVATVAIAAMLPKDDGIVARDADEELAIAKAVVLLAEVDEVARKAAKGGGAVWTSELLARAEAVRAALASSSLELTDIDNQNVASFALNAIEAWLSRRKKDPRDPAHLWPSLRAPKTLDYQKLVEIRRPDPKLPELFVGPEDECRERDGFALTDRRGNAREIEQEIDYCLDCHERDKDSCSKGLRDNKTNEVKHNPLGVALPGCPLEEKISEMHVLRRRGDVLGALVLITIDNPLCPGTGHRICNECMKSCVFQKQEPVNIPQVETRILTEVLALPFGLEIYGLLARWNPLHVRRPYPRPYTGKNVLIVGLGPAGYTLAHHLTCEGFGVVAVDGLKIEPLPVEIVGDANTLPRPVKDFRAIYEELDERTLFGFGGVSEYGITVRWDKNFLTLLYITLARSPLLRVFGGVRFGGTMTLDDAWDLGFHHVALATGAGKPTIIDMKNNLARGVRKASDFLMALQLTGAYKKSSIANLQIALPAVVVGGGLTAIDAATELRAYYPVQLEKVASRIRTLTEERGAEAVRRMFNDEEWGELEIELARARELEEERRLAAKEGRAPRFSELLDKWGGVTLVYRRSVLESPAYRLNHEEVVKSLEEGVRYVEGLAPTEAVLDARGHIDAVKFVRLGGARDEVTLPARTLCVAAGTSPNTMYEKEHEGSFALDDRKQYFLPHAVSFENGTVVLTPAPSPRAADEAFFTSYVKDGHTVSFYGDNHPRYAGSVVRAMGSAVRGYLHVVDLFPETATLTSADQPARDAALAEFFARLTHLLTAKVVEVRRLTDSIVEVVVQAPLAARKFRPGQFYRLQNFESYAPVVDGTRLAMEGLALTGAWTDEEKGMLGMIVLELGSSSRLCAALRPGEPVVLMGPTGAPTEIKPRETVMLVGGGLGNAVLFSIARAFKVLGATVLYFAGYKRGEDLFKRDDIERYTDQVVWCTDGGSEIQPRRPQDVKFRGNLVEAMVAYGKGEIGHREIALSKVHRILAIGSDRMMAAVRDARHGVLEPMLHPRHLAIGSINSPMQCMMKEVCAQCLQKHKDPKTGEETVVFSCYNQDQDLDVVDFEHLHERLRSNSMQEKVTHAWLEHLLSKRPDLLRV